MEVSVGKDNEAAVLGLGVFPRLFLADERVLVLGFCFQDDQWETLGVEQKEVDGHYWHFAYPLEDGSGEIVLRDAGSLPPADELPDEVLPREG